MAPNPYAQFVQPQPENPYARFRQPAPAVDAPIEEPPAEVPVPAAPAAPAAEPSLVDRIMGAADWVDDTAAVGARNLTRGAAQMIGLPFDLASAGLQAVGVPQPNRPSDLIDSILNTPSEAAANLTNLGVEAVGGEGNYTANPEPEDVVQRVFGRVGRELGATAVPVMAAGGVAARLGREGAEQLPGLWRYFVEPAAKAPASLVSREAFAGTAAGLGAGVANEAAGNSQEGDNFWSDLLGSIGGVTAAGIGQSAAGAAGNLLSAGLGSPRFIDDIVGEAVTDQLINNSTMLATEAAQNGGRVDTRNLVSALRRPADVEEAVPGYRANIGDRTQDPGLLTYAFDQDARMPGAANARRIANEQAVNQRLSELAPGGDPAQFRSALETGRDTRLAEVDDTVAAVMGDYEALAQRLAPGMNAEARGAAVRGGIENAERSAREVERGVWSGVDAGEVDANDLIAAIMGTTEGMPVARQQQLAEVDPVLGIPQQLANRQREAAEAAGTPLPEDATVSIPTGEVTAMRSELTNAQRNATRGPQPNRNKAEAIGRQIDAVDDIMGAALPEEALEQLELARSTSRGVNERFNRPNDPLSAALSRKEGRPDMPDSAVARTFAQPDRGQASNIDRLLAETDLSSQAVPTRTAIRDEMLADIERRSLLEKPDQLDAYLDDYSRVFTRFPDLRQELAGAGQSRRAVSTAQETAENTRRDLTTPGRSATASYLRYGDERTTDAVRSVLSSAKPRDAAKELLETAGNSPETRKNARSALWEVVKTKKFSAEGAAGGKRWNPRLLGEVFDDPKMAAVADELWSDAPEQLADIKQVFSALAGAEGSVRSRAAGSSGTAQALTGKFDPSLSASSVASRIRSVKRNQMSPAIAMIDVAATWLRNRSAQVQRRSIDTIASRAVNEPGLAAELLEKFNPADYAARRRLITQKYGARATQVLNIMDEVFAGEDPVADAVNSD